MNKKSAVIIMSTNFLAASALAGTMSPVWEHGGSPQSVDLTPEIELAHAGIPLWSFIPNGSPVVTVNSTGTATVSYTLTNNSKNPHLLVLSSNTPTGISQLGGPCVLAAKSPANPNPSCTLTLSINGSALPANNVSGGPILCQTNHNGTPNPNQCYQPSPGDTLVITRITPTGITTLSTSISPPSVLALSVNNLSLNAALTGNARQITITNTGVTEATGLSIIYPTWPGGTPATTATSNCGATLAAGASCTITITPGSNATSNCNTGIAPTPGTITVSATNATAVTSNVVVLSYGCQYQGGFLYSVDDTTPNTGSIGGKVASLVDQAAPLTTAPQATSIIWSSNGSGSTLAFVSYDIIPLISQTSTPSSSYATAQTTFNATYSNTSTFPFPAPSAFATCNGAIGGRCNSHNILALYNTYNTGYGIGPFPYTLSTGPTNLRYYAAGLCTTTINTYSDWYLPAICEMNSVYGFVTCPAGTQSMVVNLSFLRGNPNSTTPPPSTSCTPPSGTNCLAGYYWSSTQYSLDTQHSALSAYFISGSGSTLGTSTKNSPLGVRCSRALTF